MHIPYIGEVNKNNTYSSTAVIFDSFVNIKLYWEQMSTKSQLEIISTHLSNIESVLTNNVFNAIIYKSHQDEGFIRELSDIAFKSGITNVMQSKNVIISKIFACLVVKDIYIYIQKMEI